VGSRRSLTIFVLVSAVVLIASGVAGVLFLGTEGKARPPALRALDLEGCRALGEAETTDCITREFVAMVRDQEDPKPAVERISDAAWEEGGYLLSECHGIMHTVGRTYARDAGVTLASLMDYLPQANDPGCSAGFAHGMVTSVAGEIDVANPRASAEVCAAAETRFQRYSCVHGFGHAFMRLYDDLLEPALELCTELGPGAAPDCAQGAYHDYWFAVVGADGAQLPSGEEPVEDPRELCGAQPEAFVRPCWYRAFIDNRPEGFQITAAEDIDGLCGGGLAGVQREACVTAASVIGPSDPTEQLVLCAAMRDPRDAANCVRGTKVQNLLEAPTATFVKLIGQCRRFDAGEARTACYRWLGKTIAVLTDGEFARVGCPELRGAAARRDCEAGARTMDDALITFS
jgi:hypothetical protein